MRRLLLTLALCSACGPIETEESVATRQEALRRDDDGIIIMNGLPPGVLGENLLLNDEATRSKLIHSKLVTGSFEEGELAVAVSRDARAVLVLKYIVRCALGPSSVVVANGESLTGELNLCPTWEADGIDSNALCQHQVTSCLLGLSNVLGVHVPVSMRGSGAPSLTAASTVTPSTFTSGGTQLQSFSSCDRWTYGTEVDCGWEPVNGSSALSAGIADVFACTYGEAVSVGGGGTLGTMAPGVDKIIRVCPGASACDRAGHLGASSAYRRPLVTFRCPLEGSYVVMQRDYRVGATTTPTPGGMIVAHTNYLGRASETTLFPVREGAFFGTLFEGALGRKVTFDTTTKKLVTTVGSYKTPVFERLYSCFDAEWDARDAYEAKRLCGLDGQCLSDSRGSCQTTGGRAGACSSISSDLPAGSGTFKGCLGTDGLTYDDALSTFLKRPCDLISQNTQSQDCMR